MGRRGRPGETVCRGPSVGVSLKDPLKENFFGRLLKASRVKVVTPFSRVTPSDEKNVSACS